MMCTRVFVLCTVVVAAQCYENKLTKVWSSVTPQRTIVDVESDTFIVNPEGYSDGGAEQPPRNARAYFRPRSMPLKDPETTVERTVRYSGIRDANQLKKEILFPGSYFPIADAKKENETNFDPMARSPFTPKIIPLLRDEVQGRSMDGEEPLESGDNQPIATRRSYVYVDDEEEEDYDDDRELEEEGGDEKGSKKKGPKIKKKYMKYMLPLLLAYKLKFFTLIPLLMGGMVLLTGATGMAGFFFALFAAVMGLSKTTGH